MADVDVLIVGGGVVGLAVARAFGRRGVDVMVLEKGEQCGQGLSSRNSGVIHAGLYYSDNSLKRSLCIDGRDALYNYAKDRGIPYRNCGKYIVATNSSEILGLKTILEARKDDSRVPLREASPDEVRERNEGIECLAALYSPLSGIIDQWEYSLALQGETQALGVSLVCNTTVHDFTKNKDEYNVTYSSNGVGDVHHITCRRLVVAAGLGTDEVIFPSYPNLGKNLTRIRFVKGTWYTAQGVKTSFENLIYPVPTEYGLGVHLTFDMSGQVMFGPDTESIPRPDFSVSSSNREDIRKVVARYFPKIMVAEMEPVMASVRPQLVATPRDFEIVEGSTFGLTHSIFLRGIESPGLTASLAIGDTVAQRLS